MKGQITRIAVTSFNRAGYELYGRKMIDTFREYWPVDIQLLVISEDDLDIVSDSRIIFHPYREIVPEGIHFKNKFGTLAQAHGLVSGFNIADGQKIIIDLSKEGDSTYAPTETPDGYPVKPVPMPMYYDYRFNAIRFSHKVFTIFGVSRAYNCDHLIWIDGDTFTFSLINERFFKETNPGDGHISYLGREGSYSECGFLVFNRRHPIHEIFLTRMAEEYLNGEIFLLPEWHDSFIWDTHREHYEKKNGVINRNISGKGGLEEHPFINSILGHYMDHLKGDERKRLGKSFDEDWSNNGESTIKRSEAINNGHKQFPDISVIQNIQNISLDPYPHVWSNEALPEKIYQELEQTLPIQLIKSSGTYSIGGPSGKGGNYRYKSAQALSDRKIPNIWLEFFEYHTSEEFFRSAISLFEQSISEMFPQFRELLSTGQVGIRGLNKSTPLVTDCQYVVHDPLPDRETTRTPHLDNPIEIYAGLLYMRLPKDKSTGGNFIVHGRKKPLKELDFAAGRQVDDKILYPTLEVPYMRNSYGMILNTLDSIHSVSPRKSASDDRISINIIGEFSGDQRMWDETSI